MICNLIFTVVASSCRGNNKNLLSTDGGDDHNALQNYKQLGDFMSWSCSDGKEIYQKVFSMCKNSRFVY